MAGPSAKRVSAASARAHTRGNKAKPTSFPLAPAMFAPIVLAFTVGLLGWAYQALKPPPPKICGSPGGPPITSPRVRLNDGRHLAYREMGVPKEEAEFKVIVIHGFDSSKDLPLPVSQELLEELKIYFLYYDRAGYGESDPYPSRSIKSEAYDIEELADKLQIGSKFYVIGISMGAYPLYSCLKYIPERLSGASLVAPFVSYWWPWLPANMSKESLQRLPTSDQWTFRVAHYTPWLLHWWMTQKWFPSLSILTGNLAIFSSQDIEIISEASKVPSATQVGALSMFIYYVLGKRKKRKMCAHVCICILHDRCRHFIPTIGPKFTQEEKNKKKKVTSSDRI
uniref:Catalytic n=1 Tax=Rhizophora mucronata TaxID=61149 RepID=A0A2P2KWR3_RHIMU